MWDDVAPGWVDSSGIGEGSRVVVKARDERLGDERWVEN